MLSREVKQSWFNSGNSWKQLSIKIHELRASLAHVVIVPKRFHFIIDFHFTNAGRHFVVTQHDSRKPTQTNSSRDVYKSSYLF